MTEYVHVGNHAEVLANGRMIGPGDRASDTGAGDQWLIDEGRLVDVASFDLPKPVAKSTTTTGS
jgi:hypothetical protein